MATARDYRMDTGKLEPGFVTPEAFRKAVEEALKGFLKEQEALQAVRVAEEQRQIRTCGDTRTTNETRTIDRGIPYISNDVPDGPSRGVLRGTEEDDKLYGEDGEIEAVPEYSERAGLAVEASSEFFEDLIHPGEHLVIELHVRRDADVMVGVRLQRVLVIYPLL
jgi:hypothetical protein